MRVKRQKEIEKLCAWLALKGLVETEDALDSTKTAGRASKTLPRSTKAGNLIHKLAQATNCSGKVECEGYMDITKVAQDSIWLCPIGGEEIGPVSLPKQITELLEVGWEINCALAKQRGKWKIVEVGNIYPH